jgi:nucleotide-binding universal stress UspA family protein
MKTISKILVAIDFDETSLRALDNAIDLAAALGASLVVMHAYELPIVGLFPDSALMASGADAALIASTAETALRKVIHARRGRGVAMEPLLREGAAWQAIQAAADETKADLIVMGTHGRHGVLRALLGSVAEKVVRTAHKPVLTVREEPN